MESMTAPATVGEMVDALLLFDEPVLNRRFHDILLRHPDEDVKERLARLPRRVATAERIARHGAQLWMKGGSRNLSEDFVERGERALLESFLGLAENQIRVIVALALAAPTRDVRERFDAAADELRAVVTELRDALASTRTRSLLEAREPHALRSVQEENPHGDLRGQVEDAIRRSRDAQKEPRRLLLSPTGYRHLRDQRGLGEGQTHVLDVPVALDFGWDAPAFVLETYDVVPLEEVLADTDEDPAHRLDEA